MTDNRPWTQYEDRILKFIRDDQGIHKWSTIAQKMIEQFGIKGRNGKQCKQRYMQVFDENNSVLHWDYNSEQLLFMLHDKIGNKWANIGQQLEGRSDNDVKNHFYSKIRKGLRKLNTIIKSDFKKQFKQVKQNILYKIIQGAEDRFTSSPIYDQQTWSYCREAKSVLLRMGYDEVEYNSWVDAEKYRNEIRMFIEGLMSFSKDYQRKPKSVMKKEEMNLQKTTHLHHPGYRTQHSVVSYSASNCDQSEQEGSYSDEKGKSRSYNSKIINKNITNKNKQLIFDNNYNNLNNNNNNLNNNLNNNNNDNPYFWQMKMQILQNPLQQKQPQRIKSQKINPVIILKSSSDNNSMNQMQDQQVSSTEIIQNKFQLKQPKNILMTSMTLPQTHNYNNINNNNNSNKTNYNKSLLPSIPKLLHISTKTNAMIDQEDQDQPCVLQRIKPTHFLLQKTKHNQFEQDIQFQLMKQGLLEEDQDNNNNPYPRQFANFQQPSHNNNSLNNRSVQRIKSKGSNFSSYSIEDEDDKPFFTEDSNLNMRIFTTGIGGKRGQQQMFASTEKSDKLFKSLDGSGKLFQSLEMKGKRYFGMMSIQRSGEMRNEDFMGQSFQR